eukprot:6202447-Pleurochrysis_carterae.AAC.5
MMRPVMIVAATYSTMYPRCSVRAKMGKKARGGAKTSTQATSAAKSVEGSTGGGQKSSELLQKQWISPKFERVLLQIFNRFDLDGNGRLSVDELQGFAKVCTDLIRATACIWQHL